MRTQKPVFSLGTLGVTLIGFHILSHHSREDFAIFLHKQGCQEHWHWSPAAGQHSPSEGPLCSEQWRQSSRRVRRGFRQKASVCIGMRGKQAAALTAPCRFLPAARGSPSHHGPLPSHPRALPGCRGIPRAGRQQQADQLTRCPRRSLCQHAAPQHAACWAGPGSPSPDGRGRPLLLCTAVVGRPGRP